MYYMVERAAFRPEPLKGCPQCGLIVQTKIKETDAFVLQPLTATRTADGGPYLKTAFQSLLNEETPDETTRSSDEYLHSFLHLELLHIVETLVVAIQSQQ